MPKEKQFEKTIPKLYRRKFEDIAMLFWVEGQRKLVPTLTMEQSLCGFFNEIGSDDWDLASAQATISVLRREFVNLKYDQRNDKD